MDARIITTCATAAIWPVMWWLGGYDFNERGMAAVFLFAITIYSAVAVYFFPGWPLHKTRSSE